MEGGFVIEVAMFIYIGRFVFASPLANNFFDQILH